MGTATVGFKKLTIRILDGKPVTQDENIFVIEGKKMKEQRQAPKFQGLRLIQLKLGVQMEFIIPQVKV